MAPQWIELSKRLANISREAIVRVFATALTEPSPLLFATVSILCRLVTFCVAGEISHQESPEAPRRHPEGKGEAVPSKTSNTSRAKQC